MRNYSLTATQVQPNKEKWICPPSQTMVKLQKKVMQKETINLHINYWTQEILELMILMIRPVNMYRSSWMVHLIDCCSVKKTCKFKCQGITNKLSMLSHVMLAAMDVRLPYLLRVIWSTLSLSLCNIQSLDKYVNLVYTILLCV